MEDTKSQKVQKSRKSNKSKMNQKLKRLTLKHKKEEIKKKNASSTIRKFIMQRNPIKIRRNFLVNICADSGECMAIGREMKTIREYFDGFSDFHYLQSPIKKIGNTSANGVVNELKFTRGGYSSYAVLKSSLTPNSDNLAYEYQVGQYINKLCNYFPCFLETYGLYYYKDRAAWKKIIVKNTPSGSSSNTSSNSASVYYTAQTLTPMKGLVANTPTIPIITSRDIKNSLIKQTTIDYEKACKDSNYAAILIQHISNAKSLNDILSKSDEPTLNIFFMSDLPYILFQIYYTLSTLCNDFTHHDLHPGNILLYTLDSLKCIQYHYYYLGTQYSFKSKYVVKIIDYGRSYFNDTEANIHPKDIRENELCKISNCNPNCGEDVGFTWLINDVSCQTFYIDSARPNRSHDLRLINEFYYVKNNNFPSGALRMSNPHIQSLFKKLVYEKTYSQPGCITAARNARFGTEEMPDSFSNMDVSYYNRSNIQTVNDAFVKLCDVISGSFYAGEYGKNNEDYGTYTTIGDIHVYGKDVPMKYVPL